MKTKEYRVKLKNLRKYKWGNPNTFNARDGAIAFLVVLCAFVLLGIFITPLFDLIQENGAGFITISCLSAIVSQLTIFLVAYLYCKIRKVKLFGGGIILKWDFKACLPALALSLGTMLAITPLHMLFAEYLSLPTAPIVNFLSVGAAPTEISIAEVPLAFIYILIIVPVFPAICEEALFRGIVLNGFKQYGTTFAVIMSGLAFALMHGNYAQLVLQFVIGCEIGYAVLVTNNYFLGIVMHFANNFLSVGYTLIADGAFAFSPRFGGFVNAFLIIVGIALICLAIFYYSKLHLHKEKTEKEGFNRVRFAFYRAGVSNLNACLLQKGLPIDYCFAVNEDFVRKNNNDNFLFFSGRKFSKFNKKSGKTSFWIIFSIALALASFSVIGSLFSVG